MGKKKPGSSLSALFETHLKDEPAPTVVIPKPTIRPDVVQARLQELGKASGSTDKSAAASTSKSAPAASIFAPTAASSSSRSLSSVVSSLVRAQHGVGSGLESISDDKLDRHIAQIMLHDAAMREKSWGMSGPGAKGYKALLDDADGGKAAPKTNKRFLANMMRNVDDHNAQLLRLEAEAARRRDDDERRAADEERKRLYSRSDRLFGSALSGAASSRDHDERRRGRDRDRDDDDERSTKRRRRSRSRSVDDRDRDREERRSRRRRDSVESADREDDGRRRRRDRSERGEDRSRRDESAGASVDADTRNGASAMSTEEAPDGSAHTDAETTEQRLRRQLAERKLAASRETQSSLTDKVVEGSEAPAPAEDAASPRPTSERAESTSSRRRHRSSRHDDRDYRSERSHRRHGGEDERSRDEDRHRSRRGRDDEDRRDERRSERRSRDDDERREDRDRSRRHRDDDDRDRRSRHRDDAERSHRSRRHRSRSRERDEGRSRSRRSAVEDEDDEGPTVKPAPPPVTRKPPSALVPPRSPTPLDDLEAEALADLRAKSAHSAAASADEDTSRSRTRRADVARVTEAKSHSASPGPSKMDRYFAPDYDPRLDMNVDALTDPVTGFIAPGSFGEWSHMLELMRVRKDDKLAREQLKRCVGDSSGCADTVAVRKRSQPSAKLSHASASRRRSTTTRSAPSLRRRPPSPPTTRPCSASRATRSEARLGPGTRSKRLRRRAIASCMSVGALRASPSPVVRSPCRHVATSATTTTEQGSGAFGVSIGLRRKPLVSGSADRLASRDFRTSASCASEPAGRP